MWTERQIGIGPNKSDKMYGMLDLETIEGVPSFISTKTFNLFDYETIRFFDDNDILTVELTCNSEVNLQENEKIQIMGAGEYIFFEGLHIIKLTDINSETDKLIYQFIYALDF